jgi:hypothetical protein
MSWLTNKSKIVRIKRTPALLRIPGPFMQWLGVFCRGPAFLGLRFPAASNGRAEYSFDAVKLVYHNLNQSGCRMRI